MLHILEHKHTYTPATLHTPTERDRGIRRARISSVCFSLSDVRSAQCVCCQLAEAVRIYAQDTDTDYGGAVPRNYPKCRRTRQRLFMMPLLVMFALAVGARRRTLTLSAA